MAYQYSPRAVGEEDDELRPPALQPAATVPTPGANADPFQRNTTAVAGNTETRYGAVAPALNADRITAPLALNAEPLTRAATPDAFARPGQPPNLLVPSPAIAEVPAPITPVTAPIDGRPGPTVELGTTGRVGQTDASFFQPPGSQLATGAAAVGAASVAPAAAPPVVTPTPFPGTLPGATPQPSALPVAPRPLLEDDEDAFRRRNRAVA